MEQQTYHQGLLINNSNKHDNQHTEQHLAVGALIKSIVYGGTDGVINTTIILLSGVSSNTPVSSLFAICLSAIIAGALDMALCDYVSTKSEMQYISLQEKRQQFQIENFPQHEKQQMFQIYRQKDFDDNDSNRIVELLFTSKKAFLNVMMMEELGLVTCDDEQLPIKCGVVTFVAFLVSSFISFSPYLFTWAIQKNQTHPWVIVLVISSVQLISLGLAQARIIGLPIWKSPLQFLFLGVLSTSVGFVIGKIMQPN